MRMCRIPPPGMRGVILALCLGLGGAASSDAKTDSRVYNLKSKVFGKKAEQWAVEWWQWALSIPASVNPLFDETGDFVEVGQRGPVWFLGGVFNESGTAIRTATIPTGKALFFPVLNTFWDNVGVDPPLTEEELQELAAQAVAGYDYSSLQVFLDGASVIGVERMRVAAGPYAYALPEGSALEVLSGGLYQRGIVAPCVTDGYWCMLRPLPAGQHTVRFTGTQVDPNFFALDITYNLTVVESNQP